MIAQSIPQSKVPANVLKTFQTQHPNATDVEWEKDEEYYEVEFETATGEHEMLIEKTGLVIMHKGEISPDLLPAKVKDFLNKNYANREIDEVEIMTKDGKTYYEVELDGKVFDDELLISESGELIKSKDSWYDF